jgi:double-stranded uracil-DNA glycosylase
MLEDVLPPDLDIVFVGTAAGRRSASVGQYYAGPGNRFWETLHTVGLTDRRYEPSQFRSLAALRMGFTDLCKTQSGMDHQIYDWDLAGFEQKMRTAKPRAIAFTSKKAASVWLKLPTGQIRYGRQAPMGDGLPTIFVLTSPSGAARGHWSDGPWRELRLWLASERERARELM